jgi:uncharacterized protein DUF5666
MSSRLNLGLLLALGIFAAQAFAQQPNTPNATMTVNGDAGSGSAIVTQVDAPGALLLEIQSEPGRSFAVVAGTFAPGWDPVPGMGSLDLLTSAPLTLVVDGLAPKTFLDAFAKTRADSGDAFLATTTSAASAGSSLGLQAIVVDPTSPLNLSFTAATRMDFVAPVGSPAPLLAGSGGATSSGGLSASGMAGSTGSLLAEVRAPIDSLTATSVTVLGSATIEVDGTTNVRDLGGNTMSFSALAPGDFVKVEILCHPQTGVPTAHQIRLETPRPGHDVEVEAAIDSISATTVTLLGVSFDFTPSSDIDVTGGIAALSAGDAVEVKADDTPSGYEVVEIHEANLVHGAFNVSYRSRSFVDAVDASTGSITVLGQTIFVGSGVRFDGFGGLASISTSNYVEVRANPDASGQLWASRIKSRNPDSESRIEGPVDNITANSFTIWGLTVLVNGSTQWQAGLTGIGDLTVGTRVQADGNLSGGMITANEVELDPIDD